MINEHCKENCYKVTVKISAPGKWLKTGYEEYIPCDKDGSFYVVTKDISSLIKDIKDDILSIELVGIGYCV